MPQKRGDPRIPEIQKPHVPVDLRDCRGHGSLGSEPFLKASMPDPDSHLPPQSTSWVASVDSEQFMK